MLPELVANMKVRFGEFELIALAWFAGVCQKLRDRPRPLRAYAPGIYMHTENLVRVPMEKPEKRKRATETVDAALD